jgi:hypothetical protein
MAKDSNVNISLKQGGDAFGFFDGSNEYEVSALQMKRALYDPLVYSTLSLSTASTTLGSGLENLNYYAGVIYIPMTSNAAQLSAWLTSGPVAGQELILQLKLAYAGSACASGTCVISCSGVSLVTLLGLDNSRMTLYGSAASWGRVHLKCIKDGEWSVMSVNSTAAVTFT